MELCIPWVGVNRREMAGALAAVVEPSLAAYCKDTSAVHMVQSS